MCIFLQLYYKVPLIYVKLSCNSGHVLTVNSRCYVKKNLYLVKVNSARLFQNYVFNKCSRVLSLNVEVQTTLTLRKSLLKIPILGQHPLCHRMCKVTKETSEANRIMRNAIDLTSITFQWTSSSSQKSIFSTTLDGSQRLPS